MISELKIMISRDCDSRGIEYKVMIAKDVKEWYQSLGLRSLGTMT